MAALVGLTSSCAHCGATDAPMSCSRCREQRYCSKTCQATHWSESHKYVCNWNSKSLTAQLDKLMVTAASNEPGVVVQHGKVNQKTFLRSALGERHEARIRRDIDRDEQLKRIVKGADGVTAYLRANMTVIKHVAPVSGYLEKNLRSLGAFGDYVMFCDEGIGTEYETTMVVPDPTDAHLYNKIVSQISGRAVFGPVLFVARCTELADPDDVCAICQEGDRTETNSISLCGDVRHTLHIQCASALLKAKHVKCPLCMTPVTATAKALVNKGPERIEVRCLLLRCILLDKTSVDPNSIAGGNMSIQLFPFLDGKHLAPLGRRLLENKKRDEWICVVNYDPCIYAYFKGIRLKPGAMAVSVIEDVEEWW